MKKIIPSYWLQIAVSIVAMLALLAPAQAEPVAPAAKSIKAEETAILLVDFQGNFVSPDGAWYQKFAEHFAKTRMLERMVELVGFFDGMADQMVNFVYPMWSQVIDNDDFDKMIEAAPAAARKASAQ